MIKNVICAVALSLFAVAHAAPIAFTQNESGGKIQILDEKCNGVDKGNLAIATSPKGDFIQGCWGVIDGAIVIIYQDGDIKIYKDTKWTVTPYGEAFLGKSKQDPKPNKNKYSL